MEDGEAATAAVDGLARFAEACLRAMTNRTKPE